MKKILFLISFMVTYSIGNTQPCCDPGFNMNSCPLINSINISTGFDPISNSLISIGDTDPLWRSINIPPINCSGNPIPPNIIFDNAYAVNGSLVRTNWNNIQNATILSSSTTPIFPCNNAINSQPWRFRRTFCVCDSTQIRIAGSHRADDQGEIILRNLSNGSFVAVISRTQNPNHQNPRYCWGCWATTTFDTILDLQCGTYCLDFNLLNAHAGYMGFSLNGEIIDVSGRNTLLNSSDSCCNSTFISGQKILDNNCNGIIDANDDPGDGWTFELYNALGSLVATEVSNSTGEFFFNNLSFGNYEVREVSQSGWYSNIPASGTHNVTLSATAPNATIRFMNCPDTSNLCCEKFFIKPPIPVDSACCYQIYYHLPQTTCTFDKAIITALNDNITVHYDCVNQSSGQVTQHTIQQSGYFSLGTNFLAEVCASSITGGDVEIEVAFYATDGTICRDTVLLLCSNCCDGLTVHNPVAIGNCCFRIDYDLFLPFMPANTNDCIFEEVIINSLNGKISVSNDVFGSSQNSCVSQYIVKQPGSNIQTGGNEFLVDICTCPSNIGNVDVELIFRTTTGIECVDTITLICPSTTPDICCNIDDLNISAPVLNPRVRHYGSYYGIPINIPVSIPSSSIEEIRASIVSYNINYSDPDCSRCYNSYIIQGTFRINNPGALIGNLPMQSLSHYALGTNIGNNKNGVREIVWKGMPAILGNVDIPLEIMFPSPILPKCCDVTVNACIKLVFKDADCNICEEYICLEFDKNGIIH